jgi:hypothetical protein
MANLLWKTKNQTKALLETPFRTEEEFEKAVFETSEILEDVFLLRRQIRGGGKSGVPDIIGIDSDGNVCIIEMKNCTVDANIIPQVLKYAIWAGDHPGEIKALWLECEEKPEDTVVNWDDIQVRILVVAPTVLESTLDAVNKVNYPVDLIEIKRWVERSNEFLLVHKLEEEQKTKPRPVAGLANYDKHFYEQHYNSNSVKEFIEYVKEVHRIVKKRRWSLQIKYNKNYCGFKAGFFNAFGIRWIGSKTFAFFFKITEKEAGKFKPPMTNYGKRWKEAYYYITPGRTRVKDFMPLFEICYTKLTGE